MFDLDPMRREAASGQQQPTIWTGLVPAAEDGTVNVSAVKRHGGEDSFLGSSLRKSYNRSVATIAIRTPAPARAPGKESLIFQEVIPKVWEMMIEVMAHHV